MNATISRRVAPVRLGILICGVLAVLIAAAVSAPAVVPAHATTGDRTVTMTLKCTGAPCDGAVYFYQGGVGGTFLGSASMSGPADSTTKATTTQPAAADTLTFGVGSSTNGCGRGYTEYFTAGSPINYTAKEPSKTPGSYGTPCPGADSTFHIQS
jgi:hypothetical protein